MTFAQRTVRGGLIKAILLQFLPRNSYRFDQGLVHSDDEASLALTDNLLLCNGIVLHVFHDRNLEFFASFSCASIFL